MREDLKQRRLQLGLTQMQVAEGAGITERAYRYIESGARTPNVLVAKAIAKALKTSVEKIF